MQGAFPASVRLVEVAPRDGLQNEPEAVPTESKIRFIDMLARTGLREIEVTSFVRPDRIPRLADAEEVWNSVERHPGLRYSALIPNVKGLDRWMSQPASRAGSPTGIALFTAASETFTQNNIHASIDESLRNFEAVIQRLDQEFGGGTDRPFVRGYISTGFRCPFEGWIEPDAVAQVALRLLDIGVNELSIGDTVGAATPKQVTALLEKLIPSIGSEKLALHFHDTRGTALANVMSSLEMGISIFDSSAGGLGGCPYAPGAAGNVATEDLLYLLNGLGIETGVDLGAVVEASSYMQECLGHSLASKEFAAFKSAGY